MTIMPPGDYSVRMALSLSKLFPPDTRWEIGKRQSRHWYLPVVTRFDQINGPLRSSYQPFAESLTFPFVL